MSPTFKNVGNFYHIITIYYCSKEGAKKKVKLHLSSLTHSSTLEQGPHKESHLELLRNIEEGMFRSFCKFSWAKSKRILKVPLLEFINSELKTHTEEFYTSLFLLEIQLYRRVYITSFCPISVPYKRSRLLLFSFKHHPDVRTSRRHFVDGLGATIFSLLPTEDVLRETTSQILSFIFLMMKMPTILNHSSTHRG